MKLNKTKTTMILYFAVTFLMLTTALPTTYATSSSFGLVSIGDSNQSTFGGVFVSNFTGPADLGNITQINVYLTTGGTTAKAVIYSDLNGAPDALLTQSSEVNLDGTSGRWVSFDVSYVGKPNTTYWLGISLSSAGTYYYASNVTGKAIYTSSASEPPTTFTQATTNSSEDLSIYAVYTPTTSTGTTPNSQSNNWVQTALLITAVSGVIIAAIAVTLVIRGRNKQNNQ